MTKHTNAKDKGHPTPPAPAPTQARKCTKMSISVFSGDLEALDGIRDFMATRGHRITTSQAIKLALRTVALSPEMETALEAIRSEDGRRW